MNPNKAPRPDGMNACFWHRFWHIMGKDVIKVILNYLNSPILLDNINHINIALISKVSDRIENRCILSPLYLRILLVLLSFWIFLRVIFFCR